jgi:hypothetical protein
MLRRSYWRVRLRPSAVLVCSVIATVQIAALRPAHAQSIWTGNASSDWFAVGNWQGGVPTSTTNAFLDGAGRRSSARPGGWRIVHGCADHRKWRHGGQHGRQPRVFVGFDGDSHRRRRHLDQQRRPLRRAQRHGHAQHRQRGHGEQWGRPCRWLRRLQHQRLRYQFLNNPAYNAVRGPVHVFSGRLRASF